MHRLILASLFVAFPFSFASAQQEPSEPPPLRYDADGFPVPYLQPSAAQPPKKLTANNKKEQKDYLEQKKADAKLTALGLPFIDSIRTQISHCWAVPRIPENYTDSLVVTLNIRLDPDGFVTAVDLPKDKLGDIKRYATDKIFRASADAAIHAVQQCSPIKGLPLGQYDVWKEFEINFDHACLVNGENQCLQSF